MFCKLIHCIVSLFYEACIFIFLDEHLFLSLIVCNLLHLVMFYILFSNEVYQIDISVTLCQKIYLCQNIPSHFLSD